MKSITIGLPSEQTKSPNALSAKPKLGYLVGEAVDEHALARDDGVDRVRAFFRQNGRRLAFLHVSGLEDAGADSGWLSVQYLEELADPASG